MRIVLAGGSGFLGRPLASRLALSGHDVVVLTRNDVVGRPGRGLRYLTWTPDGSIPIALRSAPAASGTRGRSGDWWTEIDGADAVVNLAGANLAARRWTKRRKVELRESRLKPTQSLVAAIRHASTPPSVFVQLSAIGYYGTPGAAALDETAPPGSDFLATLCVAWEQEAAPIAEAGCRMVTVRGGIALARDGGALARLVPAFQFGVGGPLGSGRQIWSWIHRDDWVSMVAWAIETPEVSGVLNATAPKPVTNRDFSRALGRALHRPSWLPVPGFVLRTLVGEVADVALLGGQRVLPRRALELKFGFRYPDITLAMNAIFAEG